MKHLRDTKAKHDKKSAFIQRSRVAKTKENKNLNYIERYLAIISYRLVSLRAGYNKPSFTDQIKSHAKGTKTNYEISHEMANNRCTMSEGERGHNEQIY